VTPPATPAVSASPCPLPPPAEDLLAARATRVRKVIHRTKRTRTELQGPCSNCGTTSSPQWRKGPKNKPILCNACGIRFHRCVCGARAGCWGLCVQRMACRGWCTGLPAVVVVP
jgi:hypothetical protein